MPFSSLRLACLAIGTFAGAPASAHAFLDHAVPSVGGSVAASPSKLDLSFTQNVVVALCRVSLARAGGGAVPAAQPSGDGGSSTPTLHVSLAKALPPGTYVVTWHVVSVDTHPTSGTYKFTIAP